MGTAIHPTAIVDPKAKLGKGVTVGPYTIIEDNVEIGDGTTIGPHALIAWGTRMGKRCTVHHAATVGTIPQDLKFAGEETVCRIGDDTIIREYVSINRGTKASGQTVVGSNCAILAYCHIGHDCIVGNHLIVSNNLAMAGHVIVGDYVTIGGVCSFHQFTHIGDFAFIGASSYVNQDVVPFALTGTDPLRVVGINKIGLDRRGFSPERQRDIKRAYKILFRDKLTVDAAVKKLEDSFPKNDDVKLLIGFVRKSTRGLLRMTEFGADE